MAAVVIGALTCCAVLIWPTVMLRRQTASSQTSVKVEKLAAGTKYETSLYIISSGKPGPVVMVVGGIHGNEKAGYTAARKITEYKITRGTLLVLPEAKQTGY